MICQTFKISLNVVDFIPIQVLIHSKDTFGQMKPLTFQECK